jgi:hypothetical protein
MKIVHQCASTVGWTPVNIASGSDQKRAYVVHCNPWNRVDEYICECKGYINRGHCKHQAQADSKLCKWHGLLGPEEQTEVQAQIGQCPRCGGPTFRQVHEDE